MGVRMADKKLDIYDRAFKFAARVVKFLEQLPSSNVAREYQKQLIRSSGSVGANLGEADGALSRKDFLSKLAISRREARESKHWLRLIQATGIVKDRVLMDELDSLIQESSELLLILSAIIKNTQKSSKS